MPPEATEAGGAGENGDEKIIRNFIMSEPEIRVIDIDPVHDDFFLLASDGLYDRFSSQECVNFVSKLLNELPYME